ncbi:J domain-containing protein [Mesorhizobium sp. B1-1-4]|uniref:J domain-containing protein n=1 Tax=Mesorhizobium sp. B1-1-4 TaxID=2589980 RepID=UPI00112618BA|nr:J domain-containing protein [Mesorhizobium sp. B1-1-4]TPN44416.1 J domain-containing protein [Mesorhizobium sp. B1-1-4]
MADTIAPYPLNWPQGMPRTSAMRRIRSPFRTGYTQAVANVVKSLQGFQKDSGLKIEHPVLSSNVDLMGRLLDNDPGVAAWFQMDGQWVSFGVDRFPDAASNVQAIHHIIEARRVELRYGGLAIVRQTFKSFMALPAPAGSHWSDILGVGRNATRDQIEEAFRTKAKSSHPDAGGSTDAMARLNGARAAALAERS